MTETYPMGVVTEPMRIAFQERSLQEPGEGQVLIRVKAASICGSDLHVYKGRHPSAALPCAIGHEMAGEVIQVGPGVSRLKPGDRVTVEPVVTCGVCTFCLRGAYHLCSQISFQYRVGQGAFTTHFLVHERWAHLLPDNLTYEQGALIEPLAVAVHAVRKADVRPGHSVSIFGGGAIGLLALQVAVASGAHPVFLVDIHPFRLEMALRLGAAGVFNNREQDVLALIREETGELGVERAFEAVGLETTLLQALHSLRKGGQAVVLGIFEEPHVSLPANLFVQREITLSGSQGYNWDFQTAISLASAGRVDLEALITHRLPLQHLQEAFNLILNPEQKSVKVVINN